MFSPPARSRRRSLDLLAARRLLQRWDAGSAAAGAAARRGQLRKRRHKVSASFARGQLRLQAFLAPPSWADAEQADEEPPCAVCLEPVVAGRVVAGPACLHRLHEACALQLASAATHQRVVCPTCRSELLAVNCRAPGEARGCAPGGADDEEESTEDDDGDDDDDGPQRGVSLQELELLQLLLQQAARSAGRHRSWFGPPVLAPEASEGDADSQFGSSDGGGVQEGVERRGFLRFFCRRRADAPQLAPADDAAPQTTLARADADAAATREEQGGTQPQCACVLM